MAEISKILVGIDFSPASEAALKRAVALAEKTGASLLALHILRDAPYQGFATSTGQVELMGKIEDEASKILSEWMKKNVPSGFVAEGLVKMGIPYHSLLRGPREWGADFLVVGAHEKNFLKTLFLGSVAETVARKSLIPVWVERGDGTLPVKEILLPTDLSKNSEAGVLMGLKWARLFQARVWLLHVVEEHYVPSFSLIDPKDYSDKMAGMAEEHFSKYVASLPLEGLQVETLLRKGAAAAQIEEVVKEKKIGLTVLSTHGRSGLAYLVMGSVATKFLRHTTGNTLVVRPQDLDFSWLKHEIFEKT